MKKAGTVATLLRIFPYAKTALPRIVMGIVAAIAAHGFALAIPQVLRDLINDLANVQTLDALVFSVSLVLIMGILEAGMVLLRRWLVLKPGTFVEAGLRNKLYEKLQDLPVSFHDRWPSGQLLSRATQDLSLIRRWLSFGVVLLVANGVTILAGLVILFTFHWLLGLIFFLVSIPIWIQGIGLSPNTARSPGSLRIKPVTLLLRLKNRFTEFECSKRLVAASTPPANLPKRRWVLDLPS